MVFARMHSLTRLALLTAFLGSALLGNALPPEATAPPAAAPTVEFNRDIRPILSDACFHCHGPDKAKRKSNLRLDTEEGALADLGDTRPIVPGELDKSEVYRRIIAKNEKERMPPLKSGRKLSPAQIELVRRWIEQGAKWQKHWSFIPPHRPPTPALPHKGGGSGNPIDAFVLDRLAREGLGPAPEADRTTLIRRVTLDLTGLPPTPAEVDAYLADTSSPAYEKVVDRLLASPRYGERMAVRWLDGARYADTNGYQSDGERFMWRWRDWVIDAFNQNMPFDQFTIEQLAGDLVPNPTLEQKIATGFNRNHRGNAEGGIIPEEYAVEYVVDRVDTTATVWLGLTMGCARCHEHKYDPILQKDFYQVYAYFNNVPEHGRAIKYGNSPPMLKAPTPSQQAQLKELDRKLSEAESQFAKREPALATAQKAWEKKFETLKGPPLFWAPDQGLEAHYPLDTDAHNVAAAVRVPYAPPAPGTIRDGEPAFVPGLIGAAASFDGKRFLDAGNVANFGFYDKFSFAAWIFPKNQGGTILSRMKDTDRANGYQLALVNGKVQLNLVVRWLDDALRLESERSLPSERWQHVVVTYDGSRLASGVRIYVDGKPEKIKVLLDELNQTFQTKEPLRLGAGGAADSRFHGALDEVRIYHTVLSADDAAMLASPATINEIVGLSPDKRTPAQVLKLRAYFLEKVAPEALRQAHQNVRALRQARHELEESFPTTMVMEEMPTPRPTFVLIRGEYDKHGAKVEPGVPTSLGSVPKEAPANRLGFARWLVDPSNPLTARVAVNRYWQMYFGTGLVKTVDDFGSQGEWPTHPELLDWLAVEFMKGGWNVKGLQKLIVTSATYRQSSQVTPALLQKDPENRLLARGPRQRLSAEMIRDQALAASGLLVEKIGGPSVRPYQPPGLWKDLTGGEDYTPGHGEDLYRRSLYTFWKRTVAPPAMMNFDAAARETCVVRETRTNTPLQALNLMNDVTFVEAARVLAQRVMTEGGATPAQRLTHAFRLATARRPTPAELRILVDGFAHHRAAYGKDPKAAQELLTIGESPRNPKLDAVDLAAYTAVAGLILNLDETITKE